MSAPCPDAIVIGAGITGLSTALALAEAGASVELYERHVPAAMASGWTLGGVRQSGRDPAELALARHAVTLWQTLHEQLDGDTGYRQGGNLRLARNEHEATLIRTLADEQKRAGLDIALLDDEALHDVAPALAEAIVLASWCPADGHADPLATVNAYRRAAERAGVRIVIGTGVERIETSAGRFVAVHVGKRRCAGNCVLAAGIHSGELLEPIGVSLPIHTAAVTVLLSASLPAKLAPVIGVAGANLAIRQQIDGRFRFTGGAEYGHAPLTTDEYGPRVPVRAASLGAVIERTSAVLPLLADVPIERFWGGLLDMTPDALPVLDCVPGADGLVVGAGFSGHGFGIGPAVGPCLAALALGKLPPLALEAFGFARFEAAAHGAHERTATPTLHG